MWRGTIERVYHITHMYILVSYAGGGLSDVILK